MSEDTLVALGVTCLLLGWLTLLYGPLFVQRRRQRLNAARGEPVVARENQGPAQLALLLAPLGVGILLFGAFMAQIALDVEPTLALVIAALALCTPPMLALGAVLEFAPLPRYELELTRDGLTLRQGESVLGHQPRIDATTVGVRARALLTEVVVQFDGRWWAFRGPGLQFHHTTPTRGRSDVEADVIVRTNVGVVVLSEQLAERVSTSRS